MSSRRDIFTDGVRSNHRWPSTPDLPERLVDVSDEDYTEEDDTAHHEYQDNSPGYNEDPYKRRPKRPRPKGKFTTIFVSSQVPEHIMHYTKTKHAFSAPVDFSTVPHACALEEIGTSANRAHLADERSISFARTIFLSSTIISLQLPYFSHSFL